MSEMLRSIHLDQILLAFLALVALVEVVAVLVWRPHFAIPLVLACVLLEPLLPSQGRLDVGGVSIFPIDLLSATMVAAIVVRLLQGWFPKRLGAWWGLLGLFAVAALRGIAAYNIQQVGNAGRALSGFLVAVVFFAVARPQQSMFDAFSRWWRIAGAALSIYAGWWWLQHGLGQFGLPSFDRALDAQQALIVAQASVIGLAVASFRPRSIVARLAVVSGFAVVVLSEQRTVWAATLAMLIFAAAGSSQFGKTGSHHRYRALLVAGTAGVFLLLAIGPSGLTQSLTSAATDATRSNGTAAWRLEGWDALISERRAAPLQDLLVGDPLGRGSFDRVIDLHTVTVSAHSMFLGVFVTLGAVGLVFLIAGYASLLRGLQRAATATVDRQWLNTMSVLIVGQLVFSVGYDLNIEQGVVAGLAILAIRVARIDAHSAELAS